MQQIIIRKLKMSPLRFLFFLTGFLLFIMQPALYGQKSDKNPSKITITGTVTGIDGQPAADAQIYVDSVSTGVTTDNSGRYKVKVTPGARRVFAWSFMKGSGEADVNENQVADIRLDPRKDAMPDFSSAEPEVKEKTVSKKPEKANTYTNIYDMIRQEVPGVLVTGSSIVVQQQNSFFGSSAPLFLVNGVRVSSIGQINPNEVESIVLLKGSQAAIYGVEGANGVISIRLKTAADNK